MELIVKRWLRRRVGFIFNLASLANSTQACKLELGEFFTKISEDNRLFWRAYGGWLEYYKYTHSQKKLLKFTYLYGGFNVRRLNQIKKAINMCDIISEEQKKAVERIGKKKR
jgi:hypothetical protein